MFCNKCGTQLPDAAAFCWKCGNKIMVSDEKPTFSGNVGSFVLPEVNQFVCELLLRTIEKNVECLGNEKMRTICNAYARQIVPEVVSQLLRGRLNFAELPLSMPSDLQEELNKVASQTTLTVLDYVGEQMDEGPPKDFYNGEIRRILERGALTFIDNGDWQKCLKDETISCGVKYAKKFSNQGVEQIHQYVGEGQYSDMLCADAASLADSIIDSVASGAGLQELIALGRERALRSLKCAAGTYATENVNKLVDAAVDQVQQKVRRKGRGQHRSRYNAKVDAYAELLRNSLKDSAGSSVQRLLNGEDIGTVLKDCGRDVATGAGKTILQDQVQGFVSDSVRLATKHIHVSGKGSRGINKEIKNFGSDFSDSATGHITENVVAVFGGEKSIGDAVRDTAFDTGKDAVKEYARKNGERVMQKAIATITEKAAKQIGNESVKQLVLRGGGALAKGNTLTLVSGAIYDIGKSIKRFMDGEITEAELLRELGEKGTAACVSSVYASLGGMIGTVAGPIGVAIGSAVGSMVGYMASSMLYGAILEQFERTEAAKKYAAEVHAMVEVSVKRMRAERSAFEVKVRELLHNRAQVALVGFRTMDEAIMHNDFDKFSYGLNEIAKSFGKELQFKNFREFDKFMESDEDFIL